MAKPRNFFQKKSSNLLHISKKSIIFAFDFESPFFSAKPCLASRIYSVHGPLVNRSRIVARPFILRSFFDDSSIVLRCMLVLSPIYVRHLTHTCSSCPYHLAASSLLSHYSIATSLFDKHLVRKRSIRSFIDRCFDGRHCIPVHLTRNAKTSQTSCL